MRSSYIQEHCDGIKGFNRRGLYRKKQFYELYEGNEKVSPLVTQLSWTNHLLIMDSCKSDEEREFYIRLAIKERYSKRELERQMDSGYYQRPRMWTGYKFRRNTDTRVLHRICSGNGKRLHRYGY